MTQDKAHPTPPAVPSEWKAFEAWAREHLGRGYSLAMDDGVYLHPVTRWAFKAYKAGRAAPVASNTTAEPAPIQPAGVEVPDWASCETRGPWVRNSLAARIAEMKSAEKRLRRSFNKPYMGEPTKWYADVVAEAARVLERAHAAIDQALAAASQGDRGKT